MGRGFGPCPLFKEHEHEKTNSDDIPGVGRACVWSP